MQRRLLLARHLDHLEDPGEHVGDRLGLLLELVEPALGDAAGPHRERPARLPRLLQELRLLEEVEDDAAFLGVAGVELLLHLVEIALGQFAQPLRQHAALEPRPRQPVLAQQRALRRARRAVPAARQRPIIHRGFRNPGLLGDLPMGERRALVVEPDGRDRRRIMRQPRPPHPRRPVQCGGTREGEGEDGGGGGGAGCRDGAHVGILTRLTLSGFRQM